MSVFNSTVLLVFVMCLTKSTSKVKIVGGEEFNIQRVPYQVAVERAASICGGTIIDSKTVITAAHCTLDKDNIYVRAGSNSRIQGGQVVPVTDVFQHELYNKQTQDFDVSILKLEQELVFNENVSPVILPDESFDYAPGTKVTVTGWGLTADDADDAVENLRGVNLELLDRTQCNSIYSSIGQKITERMICATSNGTDACQGDSGGPLTAGHVLIGIVSWGMKCGDGEFPGVYANVKNLLPWIRSKVFLPSRSTHNNVNRHIEYDNKYWIIQSMIVSNGALAVLSLGLLCLVIALWKKNTKYVKKIRKLDGQLQEHKLLNDL